MERFLHLSDRSILGANAQPRLITWGNNKQRSVSRDDRDRNRLPPTSQNGQAAPPSHEQEATRAGRSWRPLQVRMQATARLKFPLLIFCSGPPRLAFTVTDDLGDAYLGLSHLPSVSMPTSWEATLDPALTRMTLACSCSVASGSVLAP